MNLPNRITVFRIALIPLVIVLLLFPLLWTQVAAAGVFLVAALSDMFDGRIARSRGLITDFGVFFDPLADKMLVISAMIMLVALDRLPGWILTVIVFREFSVDGLRFMAAKRGVVIAAAPVGKAKTVSQMIMVLLLLLQGLFPQALWYRALCQVAIYTALALTVVSGAIYLWRGRAYIR